MTRDWKPAVPFFANTPDKDVVLRATSTGPVLYCERMEKGGYFCYSTLFDAAIGNDGTVYDELPPNA